MEPFREEPQKALEPGAEPKRNRFRIVKLEDRIAPSKGGNTNNTCTLCHFTQHCSPHTGLCNY